MLASPTRVSTRLRALASSVLLLLASQSAPVVVDAHGYVTTPRTEFTDGVMFTKYSATMPAAFAGKFDGSPQANVDTFTKAFDAQKKTPGGFPDLRALVRDHGSECGASNPHASPKPIPSDGVVVWQNPDTGEGFVPSHTGPCEIWLDDTRVFHNDNCAGSYPSKPKAEISVDFSSCKGSCTLRFYWLALHEPTWQIYKNCIPLTGNGASASNNNNNSNNAPATDGTTGNEAMGNGNGNDNGNGNGKVTPPDEYNHPTETPSMAPSVTSEYASPAPSRRNCNKIRPSRRTRA